VLGKGVVDHRPWGRVKIGDARPRTDTFAMISFSSQKRSGSKNVPASEVKSGRTRPLRTCRASHCRETPMCPAAARRLTIFFDVACTHERRRSTRPFLRNSDVNEGS
jgi:hypothetical protein